MNFLHYLILYPKHILDNSSFFLLKPYFPCSWCYPYIETLISSYPLLELMFIHGCRILGWWKIVFMNGHSNQWSKKKCALHWGYFSTEGNPPHTHYFSMSDGCTFVWFTNCNHYIGWITMQFWTQSQSNALGKCFMNNFFLAK